MRKTLVCAAAAAYLGMAGSAVAGGMYEGEGSMKDAPAPLPPVATWTGFYIGAGVGAGAVVHELDVSAFEDYYAKNCNDYPSFSVKEVSNEEAISLEQPHTSIYELDHCGGSEASLNFDGIGGEGLFGTAQIGYDWQFKPRAVFGFFGDVDVSSISTDLDFSATGGEFIRSRDMLATNGIENGSYDSEFSGSGELELDWMWTIGARLGFLPTPDTLVYILAGYTQAEFDDPSITLRWGRDSETFSTSLDTFSGVTVGAGMETRLNHNWGLKLEYRFTQFQDEELFSWSDSWGECGCWGTEAGVSADLEPSIHTGRVLLTYRFNRAPEPLESFK